MKDITVLSTSVQLDTDVYVNSSANVVVDGEMWQVEGHFDGKRFEANGLDSDVFDAVSKALRQGYGVDVNADYELNCDIVELKTKESHPDSRFVLVSLSLDTEEGKYLLGGFEFEVGEEGLMGLTNDSYDELVSGCHSVGEDMGVDIEVADEIFEDVYDAAREAVVNEGFASKADFDVKLKERESSKSFEM